MRKGCGAKNGCLLSSVFPLFFFPIVSFSAIPADNTQVTTTALMPVASSSCTFFATDTYAGTETVSIAPAAVTTNVQLTWTLGAGSPLAAAVPCTGNYQIFFTLQLQAGQGNSAVQVTPCVKTTDLATTIYGCTTSFTFTPQCNGGNYCTVITFPFAAKVNLTVGQIINAPSVTATSTIAITGGQFYAYYLGS